MYGAVFIGAFSAGFCANPPIIVQSAEVASIAGAVPFAVTIHELSMNSYSYFGVGFWLSAHSNKNFIAAARVGNRCLYRKSSIRFRSSGSITKLR